MRTFQYPDGLTRRPGIKDSTDVAHCGFEAVSLNSDGLLWSSQGSRVPIGFDWTVEVEQTVGNFRAVLLANSTGESWGNINP